MITNTTLLILSLFGLFACSSAEEKKYSLIKDNLYSDADKNIYLKSKTREHFESGKWVDVWIEAGYQDGTTKKLKDLVDTKSFHFVGSDEEQGVDFYEDKNYEYLHKQMADGGTVTALKKADDLVWYRLVKLSPAAYLDYGNSYPCLAYPMNADPTRKPDTIHLLLRNEPYIQLMDKSEFLMSTAVAAGFEQKGILGENQHLSVNGFVTKNREIWKLVKMEIR